MPTGKSKFIPLEYPLTVGMVFPPQVQVFLEDTPLRSDLCIHLHTPHTCVRGQTAISPALTNLPRATQLPRRPRRVEETGEC